jgi:hypothetical protein
MEGLQCFHVTQAYVNTLSKCTPHLWKVDTQLYDPRAGPLV